MRILHLMVLVQTSSQSKPLSSSIAKEAKSLISAFSIVVVFLGDIDPFANDKS